MLKYLNYPKPKAFQVNDTEIISGDSSKADKTNKYLLKSKKSNYLIKLSKSNQSFSRILRKYQNYLLWSCEHLSTRLLEN